MASLRARLLALTAATVALALGMAALLTSRQTEVAFHRFVAQGLEAEERRVGDIVTFVYQRGGGMDAVRPLVEHLDQQQGFKIELRSRADSPAAWQGAAPAPAVAPVAPAEIGLPAAPVPFDVLVHSEVRAAGASTGALPRGVVISGTRAFSPAMALRLPAFHGAAGPGLLMVPPDGGFLGHVNRAMLGAALLAGSLALVLSAGLARRLFGPIEALTQASRKLAAGDLSQRVAPGSGDEIGSLGLAFNSMAESLQRQDQLRRDLVSDVAHELRTPLTNLSGYLEALRDGVLPPSAEHLASLHEEAQLLGRLVEDLQALALAEAGEQRLALRTVDAASLVGQAVDAFAAAARAAELDLRLDVAADLGAVDVDPDRVQQILRNLLSNALTHGPPGGWIRVAAAREAGAGATVDWLRVVVQDSGAGIAADHLPFVFDRFYRADPSRARATGGSGLGLAIARQLAEAHGGTLVAESPPGEGARFTLRLPCPPGR